MVAGVGCNVGEHQENLKLTERATYVNNGINMAEFQDMIDKTEVVYHFFRATAIKYAVNADVFLLPSRWEGLSNSLLESMYMKKVCVVSNVIGNRDVIYDEKTALFI